MPGTQNLVPTYVTTDSVERISSSMRLTELIMHTGEAAWTQVDAQCAVTADAGIYKVGAASAEMAMAADAAAGVQAWGQVAANNTNMVIGQGSATVPLPFTHIKFWIRSTAILAAGAFQMGITDDAAGTNGVFVDIPALPAVDTWYRMTIALTTAMKAKTSVSGVLLNMVTDTTCTIYIDDVRFCRYDGSGSAAITPLVTSTFNNTNAIISQSEMWMLPAVTRNVNVYKLPQALTLQYYIGNLGVYASTDLVGGKSYLVATQTATDLMRQCTSILLIPGAELAAGEAFEIEVY